MTHQNLGLWMCWKFFWATLKYKFYGAWWLRVANWRCFSGFLVKRNLCFKSLACLFSDWIRFSQKKHRVCFNLGRSEPDFGVSLLPCHFTMKGDQDYVSPRLRVRIKDNNNSLHGKFHRFLFLFSSKLSDLNLLRLIHVLCIYPCYVT